MGMSQELEVFLWNSKKKKGILKNIGAQMTSSVWTKKKKDISQNVFYYVSEKKVSHAGLERCDDRNFIFVQTITLMCL